VPRVQVLLPLPKNPRSSERGFFIQAEGLVCNPR